MFETNIRFVGGLLSAYALTGDQVRILLLFFSKIVRKIIFTNKLLEYQLYLKPTLVIESRI